MTTATKIQAKIESLKKQISDLKNLNSANYKNGYQNGWKACSEAVAKVLAKKK